MLEETVLAEGRTGAMDHDTVASPRVYTGSQTRGVGKAGSAGKRDKGKTLTLQITMCRRNQKIRKPLVPTPKAMVDSRKDSQWGLKKIQINDPGDNLKLSSPRSPSLQTAAPGVTERRGRIICETVFCAKNVR